jgi:hypothetical protein
MKNISIAIIVITVAGLLIGVVETFVPGFQNELVSKIAGSILFGGFGLAGVYLAHSKVTGNPLITNIIAGLGILIGGIFIGLIICLWFFPEIEMASQDRILGHAHYLKMLQKERLIILSVSLILFSTRQIIRMTFGLIELD